MITAKIIEDSISPDGKRITTLQLMYPRFIHSELMTHRVFSRNASSSRAIPVKKMLEMIRSEPAMPIHWGKNQPGMQANEQLVGYALYEAKALWIRAANDASNIAEEMNVIGLHKQVANRILEPFQHISVVLTATEFNNWFDLRAHPDAQPEIHELAIQMAKVMKGSNPKPITSGDWHLPYVTEEERRVLDIEVAKKVSAARCCRVSYLKHDGTSASIEEDILLCDRLAGAKPIHASPFEHQATPDLYSEGNPPDMAGGCWSNKSLHGNFIGWIQHRKLIEASFK